MVIVQGIVPPGPVSYTHLDVYKRQRSGFFKLLKAGFRAQGRHRHGQQECIQGVYGVHKSGDVYKRQA